MVTYVSLSFSLLLYDLDCLVFSFSFSDSLLLSDLVFVVF